MTPPAIPRPLARQIDRFARQAHAFHRYAHHPLCEPYRHEVIRLGKRTRVCKGCAFLAAGLVAGIVAGAVFRPPLGLGVAALLAAVALGPLSLRFRMPKLMSRFFPGSGIGLAVWAGWPCALASFVVVVVLALLYRRRGVERSRCDQCHERQRNPCSGFVLIVRRERAFRRRANGWLRGLPRSVA